MTIGHRIRQLRKQGGWTVAQLAYRADIHPVAVAHYECNSRQPSVDNLRRLAIALRVTLGAFHDCDPCDSKWHRGRYQDGQRLEDMPHEDGAPTTVADTTPLHGPM